MLSTQDAYESMMALAKALRGYTPPPMPPKPQVTKCPYCGKPIARCGCGASK